MHEDLVPLGASVRDVVRALPRAQPGWVWREGVIDAVVAGPPATVTVTIDGTAVPGIRYLAAYTPQANDVVWLVVSPDGVPIVVGKLA